MNSVGNTELKLLMDAVSKLNEQTNLLNTTITANAKEASANFTALRSSLHKLGNDTHAQNITLLHIEKDMKRMADDHNADIAVINERIEKRKTEIVALDKRITEITPAANRFGSISDWFIKGIVGGIAAAILIAITKGIG